MMMNKGDTGTFVRGGGRRFLTSLIASTSLFGAAGALAQSTASVVIEPSSRAIDGVMQEAVRDGRIAGAVVGVVENGRIAFVRGYGMADVEQGSPVQSGTVFRIGSITKQFTAASILLLVERKQLSLEDRLEKFVPGYPRARDITIRQLLTHTAGVRDYVTPVFMARDSRLERSSDQQMAYLASAGATLEFEPGTAFKYSNTGYELLGAVIEKASGMPYGAFLKTNIFDPLGLHDTAVDDLRDVVAHRAEGYIRNRAKGGWVNDPYLPPAAFLSSGSLRSTAADLLNWHLALFDGKLLKPASVAMMIAEGRLGDGRPSSRGSLDSEGAGEEYGFAMVSERRDGVLMLGHGGGVPGFSAWMRTLPEQRKAIVLLTNTQGAAGSLSKMLVPALLGRSPAASSLDTRGTQGTAKSVVAPTTVQPSAALIRRGDDLVKLINGRMEPQALLNEALLARASAAVVKERMSGLTTRLGAAKGVTGIEAATPESGTVVVEFERGRIRMSVTVDPQAPYRISALRPASIEPR